MASRVDEGAKPMAMVDAVAAAAAAAEEEEEDVSLLFFLPFLLRFVLLLL